MVFVGMLQRLNWTKEYSFDTRIAMEVFKSMITSVLELSEKEKEDVVYERKDFGRKIKIGLSQMRFHPLFTEELPHGL